MIILKHEKLKYSDISVLERLKYMNIYIFVHERFKSVNICVHEKLTYTDISVHERPYAIGCPAGCQEYRGQESQETL